MTIGPVLHLLDVPPPAAMTDDRSHTVPATPRLLYHGPLARFEPMGSSSGYGRTPRRQTRMAADVALLGQVPAAPGHGRSAGTATSLDSLEGTKVEETPQNHGVGGP